MSPMNRLQVSHRTERDRRGRGQQQEARLHSTGGNRTDDHVVKLLFLHQTNPSLKKINLIETYNCFRASFQMYGQTARNVPKGGI